MLGEKLNLTDEQMEVYANIKYRRSRHIKEVQQQYAEQMAVVEEDYRQAMIAAGFGDLLKDELP